MAETFKVGANARELLRYTQRATRIVTDDISRSDARKIIQKVAALEDVRDIQKVCGTAVHALDTRDREGFSKSTFRLYGEGIRLTARIKYYGRYMDDFYIICSDKKKLQCILRDVRALMDSYGLELNQKTAIFPLRNGIDFLGFHSYLTDTGAVIQKLRRDSSKRMKNKIKYWETAYPAGEATKQEILLSFDAWDAHAAHGDTYSLRRQYADRLEKLLECKIPIHRKINSNKLARDRRRARQCRCIYKKQHKALSLSVSQNTRPAEIMPWA